MSNPDTAPPKPSVTTTWTEKTASPAPFWWPETRAFIVGWMMMSSFAVIVLVWWRPPPADNQLLNTLLGLYFGSGLIMAIQWWVGSSKGSDDKSTAINKQLTTVTPPPEVKP